MMSSAVIFSLYSARGREKFYLANSRNSPRIHNMDQRYDSGYNYGPMNRMRGASVVKILIIVNSAVYLVELFAQYRGTFGQLQNYLAMVPQLITGKHYLWQFVTAMFMHGDFFHIFFNM